MLAISSRWSKVVPADVMRRDHNRQAAPTLAHFQLDEMGYRYAPRFQNWDYLWTDDCIGDVETAAQSVLEVIRR